MARIVTLREKPKREPDFTIEKEVPFPGKQGRSFKYKLGRMAVGDSFAIGTDYRTVTRVRSNTCQFGKRHKKKFSVIKNEDGEYRCWRIK